MEMFDVDLRAKDKSTHPLRVSQRHLLAGPDRRDSPGDTPARRSHLAVPVASSSVTTALTRSTSRCRLYSIELTHTGFDVFLDRYSIPSGYDLQRRLNQELLDKSMVVLLESKDIQHSDWTRHEISFTVRNRLGLLTVPMPDVDPQTYLGSAARKPLDALEFVDGKADVTGMWGRLRTTRSYPGRRDQTRSCGVAVQAERAPAHGNRLYPERQRGAADVFRRRSLPPHPAIHRSHHLHHHPSARSGRFPRSPFLVQSSAQACAKGVIVGPCATSEPDREKRLQWLEKVTGCETFDEGKLVELAGWLLTGQRV